MKKKLQTIQVEYQDLWTLLLSTIRYSMGRTTYMPEYCIDLYLNYGRKLSVGCKKQIANEIKEKLLMSEMVPTILGHECDCASWKKLFNLIERELEESESTVTGEI